MRLCSAHHVLCTFLFNISVFKLAINYSIFLSDCGPFCRSIWNQEWGYYLLCENKRPVEELIGCAPTFTNVM